MYAYHSVINARATVVPAATELGHESGLLFAAEWSQATAASVAATTSSTSTAGAFDCRKRFTLIEGCRARAAKEETLCGAWRAALRPRVNNLRIVGWYCIALTRAPYRSERLFPTTGHGYTVRHRGVPGGSIEVLTSAWRGVAGVADQGHRPVVLIVSAHVVEDGSPRRHLSRTKVGLGSAPRVEIRIVGIGRRFMKEVPATRAG
jgi:hypothetical protein